MMRKHSFTLLAAATPLAALALTACSTGGAGATAAGSAAPAVSGVTGGGDTFNLRDKRGSVIVMDFYANW